jgi:hypothetical protein
MESIGIININMQKKFMNFANKENKIHIARYFSY